METSTTAIRKRRRRKKRDRLPIAEKKAKVGVLWPNPKTRWARVENSSELKAKSSTSS